MTFTYYWNRYKKDLTNKEPIEIALDAWSAGINSNLVEARVSPKTCVEFNYAIGDTVWIKEMESEAKILSLWYAKTGIRYQCRWAADGKYNEEYLFEDELLAKKP